MTAILHRLPFFEREDEIAVGTERIRIRPYQILVWVSLTAKEIIVLPPSTSRFPALLDTGHNHNFSLQRKQLIQWAGIDPTRLEMPRKVREAQREADLYSLKVWLHPNQPGQRDHFVDRPPFCFELPRGVAVYPESADFPRLPLLGLRALVTNKLHIAIDSDRCVVNVRTADWSTRLCRWLFG